MVSLFKKEFTVSSYELDPNGKARLTTMANYFQEVAYHHANRLGFGYDQMKDRRTLWMLSRMKIQMYRYPVWNEKVVVETWPSGIEKLFALRDFRVKDRDGNILGLATTYWLIVNLDSHRPIRPGAELERFSNIEYGDPVFDTKLEKIHVPDNIEPVGHHRVVFSDLDIVGHVNNVKYMEWCLDASLSNDPDKRTIVEFEINFLHEATLGNQVVLSGADGAKNSSSLLAYRKEDGKELIRVRIDWEDR